MDTIFEPLPQFSQPPTDLKLCFQLLDNINIKWQAMKETVELMKINLTSSIADTFKKNSFGSWRTLFAEFLDQLGSKVISTYNILADLNHAKNENPSINASNSVLKEFVPSIQNAFIKLNTSLLQITLKPFQSKIYIESNELLESVTRIDNLHSLTKIFYFTSIDHLPAEIERVLNKRIAEKDLVSITKVFREKLLAVLDKKIESLHFHLKTVLEQQLSDVFEQLLLIIGKITAKIAHIQSLAAVIEQESEFLTIQSTLNDFFFRNYPLFAQEFEKHIKLLLSDEFLGPRIEETIKQLMKELASDKESTSNKMNLHQFFIFEQAKVIYNSILPTCMMVLKDTKPLDRIEVKPFSDLDSKLSKEDKKGITVFHLNYVFFALVKSSELINQTLSLNVSNIDMDATGDADAQLLFTNDPVEVEKLERWQLLLDFLPPNLEISRHESLILYFFTKLAEDHLQKKRDGLNKSASSVGSQIAPSQSRKHTDDENFHLRITVESFFAYFFTFLKLLLTPRPPKELQYSMMDFDALNESILSTKHITKTERIHQSILPDQILPISPIKEVPKGEFRGSPARKTIVGIPYDFSVLQVDNPTKSRKMSLPDSFQSPLQNSSEGFSPQLELNPISKPKINKQTEIPKPLEPSKEITIAEEERKISHQDSKGSFGENNNFNSAKIKTLDTFDNLQISDLTEVDQVWENCDTDSFRNLIEKGQYRFFNDLNSFKEISGCNNYLFVDKADSAQIFKEFMAYNRSYPMGHSKLAPPRLEELKNSHTQRILAHYDPNITKGIVLLFVPHPSSLNLILFNINFEAKTKTSFFVDTPNTDALTIKELLNRMIKFMKHTIKKVHPVKYKFSKFKEGLIFFKFTPEALVLNSFRNFYFPYLKLVKEEFLSSSEGFTIRTLRESLFTFLFAIYESRFGISNFRNLLQVYSIFQSRFQSLFIMDEFYSMDIFYSKVQQYLNLCFVDNLETHTRQKLKSLLFLARIFNDKSRTFDIVVIFFEYAYPDIVSTPKATGLNSDFEESFTPSSRSRNSHSNKPKGTALQNFYVFGDTYLYLLQVRNIIKNFFSTREEALSRVQFSFCTMNKEKTQTNLFFLNRTILYCIICILLNEGVQIQDLLCICRLSPSVQYNYFCLTLEKVRSMNQKDPNPKKNINLPSNLTTFRVRCPKVVNLIQETHQTLENLGLIDQDILKTQVDVMNHDLTIKRLVVYMSDSASVSRNSRDSFGTFNIETKDSKLPHEPFTMIIVNKYVNAGNTNICNIIEPDGAVYSLRISSEDLMQPKYDKTQDGIMKSVENIKRGLPRLKNYKPANFNHIMFLKNLSWDNIQPLVDYLIIYYINRYKQTKDFRFIVNENSILSLIFSDSNLYSRSFPENLTLLTQLKDICSLTLDPNSIIVKTCKYYQDEYLSSLFAIFFATERLKIMIFCVQNDTEYTFHIVTKNDQASISIVIISVKDQSHGFNAKNHYQELLNRLQRDLCNIDIKYDLIKMEIDPVASFFYSTDPDLLVLGLVDALTLRNRPDSFFTTINELIQILNEYVECWYKPSILSGQLMGLSERLRVSY